MSLVVAPPAVVALVCVIAYVSVGREHRKGRDSVRPPAPEAGPAE